MDHEVATAIPRLVERGLLDAEAARPLLRSARDQRVGVRADLQVFLWLGVLLLTTGVGLRLASATADVVTLAVAAVIAAAAALTFRWVGRHAEPFSWRATSSPHLAFDYLLLLAALLVAALLAWLEARVGLLGDWQYHLLLAAVLHAGLALRHDSRALLGLALTSFTAWQGLALTRFDWIARAGDLRLVAGSCGLAFVVLAMFLVATGIKPHFEPVASELGSLLVLGAILAGLGGDGHWYSALGGIAAGSALTVWARRHGRLRLFGLGVLVGWIGASGIAFRLLRSDTAIVAWVAASALALVVLLLSRLPRGAEEP